MIVILLHSLHWRVLGTDLKAAVCFIIFSEGGDGVELKMKKIKVEKP